MKKKRGIAMVTILVTCAILLAIVGLGLKMGSDGVLFVSQAHQRNVALAAAESGVYEAMVAIQTDLNHSGTVTGQLPGADASYSYFVQNDLLTSRTAVVTSTGRYGRTTRTVRARLEPDSGGFDALSVNGKVYVFDQAYVNGIVAPDNPIPRPGHAHTEFSSGSAPSFVGRDFEGDGTIPNLHASGKLTTPGTFDPALTMISSEEATGVSKPSERLDVVDMQSGTFQRVTGLAPGMLTTNTEVDVLSEPEVIVGMVIVPKGVKLVMHGETHFLGGISGEGEVVVKGDCLIRTGSNFDPNTQEGLKLHSEGSLFVAHPSSSVDGGTVSTTLDPIGDYFAQMPIQASSELSVHLPVSAPRGGDFFNWYTSGTGAASPDFENWYNGDGTDIYPGLSQETKLWLNQSSNGTLSQDIADWASSSAGP